MPKELVRQGIEVIRMMPLYQDIDREKYNLVKCDVELHIPLGHAWYIGTVWMQEFSGVTTYFIHSSEFFQRPGLYGCAEHGYADNFERFLFFQKAVVSLIDNWNLQPDIVHCNDWQTGLVPMLLYHGIDGRFRNGREKTLMTIHNLAHQGWASAEKFYMTQLPVSCYTMHTLEFYGEINMLKGGLVSATAINTVSPAYAGEIKTPRFGCRLNGVLYHRQHVLHGILNGIDYSRWNPESDPYIAANYSVNDLSGKSRCKEFLQQTCGFEADSKVPLIGLITRLVPQKGIDMLMDTVERMIGSGAQLVLLGSGDSRYEAACRDWQDRWPEQVCSWIEFSREKAHWIEAGADMFLMPSEFEPCGQNQLYSMRYGTIPIVHATGGLEDSVIDYAEKRGTGFKFREYTATEFWHCIQRALDTFSNPRRWKPLMKRAMQQDFSVVHMARDYITLYETIASDHEKVV